GPVDGEGPRSVDARRDGDGERALGQVGVRDVGGGEAGRQGDGGRGPGVLHVLVVQDGQRDGGRRRAGGVVRRTALGGGGDAGRGVVGAVDGRWRGWVDEVADEVRRDDHEVHPHAVGERRLDAVGGEPVERRGQVDRRPRRGRAPDGGAHQLVGAVVAGVLDVDAVGVRARERVPPQRERGGSPVHRQGGDGQAGDLAQPRAGDHLAEVPVERPGGRVVRADGDVEPVVVAHGQLAARGGDGDDGGGGVERQAGADRPRLVRVCERDHHRVLHQAAVEDQLERVVAGAVRGVRAVIHVGREQQHRVGGRPQVHVDAGDDVGERVPGDLHHAVVRAAVPVLVERLDHHGDWDAGGRD